MTNLGEFEEFLLKNLRIARRNAQEYALQAAQRKAQGDNPANLLSNSHYFDGEASAFEEILEEIRKCTSMV